MKKSIQKCEMNNHLAEQSVVAVLTSRFVSIVSSVAAAAGGPDLEVGRLRFLGIYGQSTNTVKRGPFTRQHCIVNRQYEVGFIV